MDLRAVQSLETRIDALVEHQAEVRTGQHHRFASLRAGQAASRLHEYLSMRRRRDPGAGHRYVRLMNLEQIVDGSNDFHVIENTIEACFHHDPGSKQPESLVATLSYLALDHVEQIDDW